MSTGGIVAGTIELQMLANMARLASDMQQAKALVGSSMKEIERAVDSAKKVLAALGVGLSVAAIVEKVNSVTDSMAKLQDASDKTGVSVEKLSQLQFFAGVSGSSLDAVVGALAKLSKGMSGAGNDTAATSQAFKFLGISAKDAAGNLKDPGTVMEEIAKKLIAYEDGAGKAAIAQALFGKSGAEILPTLKKMAEMGSVVTSVTKAQAQAAQEYQLQQALLHRQTEILWNTVVSQILPSLESLTKVLLGASQQTDSLGGTAQKLANDHSIESWADMAVMGVARVIDVLKVIPQTISAVSSSFQVIVADLQLVGAATALGNPSTFGAKILMGQNPLASFTKALNDRNDVLAAANAKYDALWNAESAATEKRMAAMIAARKANREDAARDAEGSSRPGGEAGKKLDFALGDAAKAAAELKLYTSTMQGLEKQYFSLTHAGEVALIMYETTRGTLKKLTEEHKADLLVMAAKIDAHNRLIAIQEQAVQQVISLSDAQEKGKAIALDYAGANRLEVEAMGFALSLIGKTAREQELLTAAHKIDLDVRKQIDSLPKDDSGDILPGAIAAAERIRTLADEQKRAVLGGIAVRQQAERDWATGAQSAFNDYVDHATNAAEMAKNAFTSAFKGLEDAMFEYFRHGKLGMATFVSMIKDQLARLAAQQFTLSIVGSVSGSLGMSSAASAASGAGGLGNLASLGGNLIPGGVGNLLGTAAVPAVGDALIGGTAAAGTMIEGTGILGMMGTAGAGISAALAAIPGWGWAAMAALAVLGGGDLFGGSGPKGSDASLRRRANGDFGVEMNNVEGGNPDIAQVMALNAALNDKSKFDPAVLAGLVDSQVGTGSPADTATLINALTQKLAPAAQTAAEAQAKLAAETAAAVAALQDLTKTTSTAVDAQLSAVNSALSNTHSLADAFRKLAGTIADTIISLKGGSLSPLTPLDKLGLSRSTLNTVFSQALGGDQVALGKLPQVATDFLTASRDYNSTSIAYGQDFQIVLAMLDQAQSVSSTVADVQDQIAAIQQGQLNVLGLIKDELAKQPPDPQVLAALNTQLQNDQGYAVGLQSTLDTQLSTLRATFDASLAINTAALGAGAGATIAALGISSASLATVVAITNASIAEAVTATGVSAGIGDISIVSTLGAGFAQVSSLLQQLVALQSNTKTGVMYQGQFFNSTDEIYSALSTDYQKITGNAPDAATIAQINALVNSATPTTIPSHASGLDRVPYDGYVASLHRDETVLNRDAAAAWRARSSGADLSEEITKLRRDIARMSFDVQQTGKDQVAAVKQAGDEMVRELKNVGRDVRKLDPVGA